ncbi:MAG TPA: EAL domain-containing protein [Gammaproteobacteria bacterium]|nr:EAL domain-containing protein [Gammaproteobacteria bacterium]
MSSVMDRLYTALPGFQSLRGRYLYLALLFILLLGGSAIYGWNYVENISQQHIGNIKHRADASTSVNDIAEQIRVLEIALQRLILIPSKANIAEVRSALELKDAALERLKNVPWVQNENVLMSLANGLSATSGQLQTEIERLIDVRTDEMQWIPANRIMQDEMLPHHLAFISAVDTALDQVIDGSPHDPAQHKLYQLLVELQRTWQQLVSEFRLYISNRMGMYPGTPAAGMLARATNIEVYSAQIDKLMQKLAQHRKNGAFEFDISAAYQDMQSSLNAWRKGYQQVDVILASDNWRTDIALLNDFINPLLSRFREQLSTLQLELSINTARDITRLTQVARRLSDSVVVLAIIGITFVISGFVFFNRALLSPIGQVTHALKKVSRSATGAQVPESSLKEIRDLTTAFREMQEQVRTRERHLDHLAHHDSLTELPNRTLFHDRLDQALLHADRNNRLLGLMFLDLDNFKTINDGLGHETGDLLLRSVAARLQACVRKSDTIARLGGDEFAILVEDVDTVQQVERVSRKVLDKLSELFRIDNRQLYITTSIGITLYPQDETDTGKLLKNADIAMYHAKELGRNQYQFYSRDMTARIAERIEIEDQLRRALKNNEFEVYFQPVTNLESGAIISAEALLRWHHPQRGLISAGKYIDILEQTGLIEPLTLWVLQKACAGHRYFRDNCQMPICISINLSGRLLRNRAFIDTMLSHFDDADIAAEYLIVEITEDTLLEDFKASGNVLRTLSEKGIRISMDDFGTRQSSLSHLRHAPIDIVKIDKEFIRDIPHEPGDSRLVAAIIAMGHGLQMKVVAEGVEKQEQLEFLRAHHCDFIQGYLFSPALPVGQMSRLFERANRTQGGSTGKAGGNVTPLKPGSHRS